VRRLLATAVVLAFGALALGGVATAGAAPPRTITLVNHTEQTIWPAASPGSTAGQSGWTLKPGAEVSFQVPHDWNARLWGRTGCHFGGGAGGCRTGDCDGRYQCGGWGTIPATLGEFNFDAYKGLDFYDISMVDGSNLPMYATPTTGEAPHKVGLDGCLSPTKCTTEVRCPASLRVPRHGGPEVGCISPCARFGSNRYCCRGPFAAGCSPAKTWPVDYAKVFKRAEPYAYSWSGDDPTSVFTCKGTCDYTITFGTTAEASRSDLR
jgi:Thaumatin family